MKKIFLILVSIALISSSLFADDTKNVKSKINKVTVFLQGAQVSRTANVSIAAGTTDIIFNGVSPYLNTNSVKAGGIGSFIIMGVRYNTEYVPPGTKKENVFDENTEKLFRKDVLELSKTNIDKLFEKVYGNILTEAVYPHLTETIKESTQSGV